MQYLWWPDILLYARPLSFAVSYFVPLAAVAVVFAAAVVVVFAVAVAIVFAAAVAVVPANRNRNRRRALDDSS